MKVLIYVVLFVGMLLWSWMRKKGLAQQYGEAAFQLGIEAKKFALSGTVEGHGVRVQHVSRRAGYRRYEGVAIIEVELETAPADLYIAGRARRSRFGVAAHDLRIGEPHFDGMFRVMCQNDADTQDWLGDEARRAMLLELDDYAEDLRLDDRWLGFEVKTNPQAAADIVELVRFVVAVARRIDTRQPGSLTDLGFDLAPRRRDRGSSIFLAVVWALVIILFLALMAPAVTMLFDAQHKGEAVSEARARDDAFVDCVQSAPKTPTVDFAKCDELLERADPSAKAVRQAARTMAMVRARQAARVKLDRKATADALVALADLTDKEFTRADVLAQYWDHGLLDEFVQAAGGDSPLVGALESYSVLREFGVSLQPISKFADENFLIAAQCLDKLPPDFVHGTGGAELAIPCTALTHTTVRWPGTSYVKDPEGRLAGLESDDERAVKSVARSRKRDPRVDLLLLASALAAGEPTDIDVEALASRFGRVSCGGAWTVHPAAGKPEVWLAAAPKAGPLEAQMRLLAARQWAVAGDLEHVREALAGLDGSSYEGICGAQLEVALGDPGGALERLSGRTITGDTYLELTADATRAEALFMTGDYEASLAAAQKSLEPAIRPTSAAPVVLVAIAAALELGQPDDLDEWRGGKVTTAQTPPPDTIAITRWAARAARDDVDDAEDRWVAPAEVPIEPGCAPLMFYVLGKLAPPDKVELWLDMLLPSGGFDPFGVTTGRRVAAELRGDDEAAAKWRKLEEEQRSRAASPAGARLYRMVRQIHPGR